ISTIDRSQSYHRAMAMSIARKCRTHQEPALRAGTLRRGELDKPPLSGRLIDGENQLEGSAPLLARDKGGGAVSQGGNHVFDDVAGAGVFKVGRADAVAVNPLEFADTGDLCRQLFAVYLFFDVPIDRIGGGAEDSALGA